MSYMGVDIGTTGCKAVVFDTGGRQLARAYRKHPLLTPREDRAELDSRDVLEQCLAVIREAAGAGGDPVRALCVSSQGEAFTPVGADGAVLGNAMVSSDGRASAITQSWSREYGLHDILSNTVPRETTWGTVHGRVRAEPFTYLRLSTDDYNGRIMGYLGKGELTDDPLTTFGGYGVVRIPNYQRLLTYICETGYEHHVSINLARTARSVNEALGKYLGWDMYYHL